jgi:dihydrofolate reductase
MNHYQAIAAMSLNRVIGRGSRIPWHLPDDFRWFKTMTTGHVLLMGRKTYESIGKPLPNRETVILSQSGFQVPGIRTVADFRDIDPAREERKVFICGGAQVYRAALPHCSVLYLTLVKQELEGDVYFPPFEESFELVEEIRDTPDFKILHYRNRKLEG